MTNVTISISISQIFRFWVAIFQPRLPKAVFISQLIRYAWACSSYGCFILRATRLSNKPLEQGYVKERLKSSLRKFYGRYGDLIKQYEVSLTQMLNDILWPDHLQWKPPTDQTLYRTRPFTKFWVVSIEHLRRVWHADRGRLFLRKPGPVPYGICKSSFVETTDTQSYITPVYDTFPWLDFLPTVTWLLKIGFHRASATGVACRQGTLTPPDTWSRPFGTCICSTCWDQSFSELVVILPDLYSHLLQKNLIKFVLYSTWMFVRNMRICDVLLFFFQYIYLIFYPISIFKESKYAKKWIWFKIDSSFHLGSGEIVTKLALNEL